jgi:hypothetical protein
MGLALGAGLMLSFDLSAQGGQATGGQVSYPPVLVRDESTDQGRVSRAIDFTGAGVTCTASAGVVTCNIPGGAGAAYATIQDEGTPLTQRSTLNFIGTSINCVDNGGTSTTDCTLSGSGSGLTHPEVMSRVSLRF